MSNNTAAVMSSYDTSSYYCQCNEYNVNDGRGSGSAGGNLMAMLHHPSCYYHTNGRHIAPYYPQNGYDTRTNNDSYGYISASAYLNNNNNNNNNYYDDNHISSNIATIAGNNKVNKVFHNCISYSAAEKKVDYTMAPTTTIETITITRPLKVSLFFSIIHGFLYVFI